MNKLLKTSLGGLLLALSLISLQAFADYTAYKVSNGSYFRTGATPQLACQAFFEDYAGRDYISASFPNCIGTHPNDGTWTVPMISFTSSGSCPSPLVDDGFGNCIEEITCPDSGTLVENYQYPIPSSGSSVIDIDGCGYTMSDITICYKWEGEYVCSGNAKATGEQSPSGSPPASDIGRPDSPVLDDTVSTSETEVEPTVVSTLPDSTVVTTEEKTVTNTDKAGTIVDNGDSTITITNSDGTVSTYSENKVTTVYPDGSVTEQITKDTTVSTPDKQKDTIKKIDGTVITNITSGDTINHNEVVINNYNSGGKLVSSDKTSTGSGESGDEGDSEKEGNCGAPGQPICEVKIKDTSADYADQTAKLNQIASDEQALHDEQVEDLKDGENDYGASEIDNFSVDSWVDKYTPFPTSTTCTGDISTSIFGKPFVLSPCVKLQPLRDILAWVFFILTIFTVIRITLDRKII